MRGKLGMGRASIQFTSPALIANVPTWCPRGRSPGQVLVHTFNGDTGGVTTLLAYLAPGASVEAAAGLLSVTFVAANADGTARVRLTRECCLCCCCCCCCHGRLCCCCRCCSCCCCCRCRHYCCCRFIHDVKAVLPRVATNLLCACRHRQPAATTHLPGATAALPACGSRLVHLGTEHQV